jgi:hypothetical protein
MVDYTTKVYTDRTGINAENWQKTTRRNDAISHYSEPLQASWPAFAEHLLHFVDLLAIRSFEIVSNAVFPVKLCGEGGELTTSCPSMGLNHN